MADIEIEVESGEKKEKKGRGFIAALMDYLKNRGKGSNRPAFSYGTTGNKDAKDAWDQIAMED